MTGARRLVLLFALTILLPGLLLAGFGARALFQERALAAGQWRQRLDGVAAAAARELARELESWTEATAAAGNVTTSTPVALPDGLRRAIDEPGTAAIRIDDSTGPQVWPLKAIAYLNDMPRFATPPTSRPLSAEGGTGEAPAAQIRRYEELLPGASGDDRAWLLHRLARSLRAMERRRESDRALEALEKSGSRVLSLPADFLARYERVAFAAQSAAGAPAGAIDLYEDLVHGQWQFEEARYRYYVSQLREWSITGQSSDPRVATIDAARERKEALTAAVWGRDGTDAARRYLFLTPRLNAGAANRAVLLVDRQWLCDYLISEVIAPFTADAGFLASVNPVVDGASSTGGQASDADPLLRVNRAVAAAGLGWRIEVWPKDPDAVFAEIGNRQRLYLAMLGGVLAILVSGSYLTSRVVRREMEVARMKSDFVAAVSHEFRSPLTGIRQLSEMLMRGRVPNEARRQEYYERLTRESDRLSRVVENLLDFARMEAGRQPYRFEHVEAGAWLAEAAATLGAQEAFRSHEVVTDLADGLPPVKIDRAAMTTALGNLIANAVKYSPDSRVVWLAARPANGELVISVRDRGVGIAPVDQPHVFERFFRGGQEGSSSVSGTGLGLSLVRHIVAAHGGTVELESAPGSGTTVSIHLRAGS